MCKKMINIPTHLCELLIDKLCKLIVVAVHLIYCQTFLMAMTARFRLLPALLSAC